MLPNAELAHDFALVVVAAVDVVALGSETWYGRLGHLQ